MKTPALALALAVVALTTGACAISRVELPAPGDPERQHQLLTRAITALGPAVQQDEAALVARTALDTISRLAGAYRMVRPPLLNNVLVNTGMRPRGLCCHWADDLIDPLLALDVPSLYFRWAVANHGDPNHEHNTVVVLAFDTPWTGGLAIDPWRTSGQPYWITLGKDQRYDWLPHELDGQWDALHCN